MKMAVLWDVEPCNLAEIDQKFERFLLSIIRAISPLRRNDGQ
jgi:hypothetical protein